MYGVGMTDPGLARGTGGAAGVHNAALDPRELGAYFVLTEAVSLLQYQVEQQRHQGDHHDPPEVLRDGELPSDEHPQDESQLPDEVRRRELEGERGGGGGTLLEQRLPHGDGGGAAARDVDHRHVCRALVGYVSGLAIARKREPVRLLADVAARSIPPEELRGATITLSNFGMIGGRFAALIVVPPQVAILGAGRIGQRVLAHQGAAAVRRALPLSLTFDHRVVTGGEAARFLAALKSDLETAS